MNVLDGVPGLEFHQEIQDYAEQYDRKDNQPADVLSECKRYATGDDKDDNERITEETKETEQCSESRLMDKAVWAVKTNRRRASSVVSPAGVAGSSSNSSCSGLSQKPSTEVVGFPTRGPPLSASRKIKVVLHTKVGTRTAAPLFLQKDIQKGVVNPNLAVIFDEAEFSEAIHEKTYSGASGADHLS